MLRDDQLALLRAMPPHWRYAITGLDGDAKRCIDSHWNSPGNGLSLEEVIRLNTAPLHHEQYRARKCIGLGVVTGEESSGLLVIDFDGHGSQAVRQFRQHFRHFPSDLPKTVANVSGKKGRAKLFFQVGPNWWPELEKRSASWRIGDSVVLEAIWMNSTGKGRHAVIVGDHPQTSPQHPLFYRWLPGCSPAETQVAVAPDWLLLGVIAQMEGSTKAPSARERERSGDEDATPWERLAVKDRVMLAAEALPYCPNRDGRGSGTYEKVRRILCGLINEFGLNLAKEIVVESGWDDKNEWDQGMTTLKAMDSLAKSTVGDEHKATVASLFYFADANGWKRPSWALPPKDTKEEVENLRKLVNIALRDYKDKVAQLTYFGKARREFGIDGPAFRELMLNQFLGTNESAKAVDLEDLIAKSRSVGFIDRDVIDGVLARRVCVLAGASHSGKTTLACFLANRVIHGIPLDISDQRHVVEKPGRVLIFTSDCSDVDMLRDLALEGVDDESASRRVRICSGATFDNMLDIVQELSNFQPDYVVYDCLTSMACQDIKIGDPAYASPIRLLVRHNGTVWPKAAHLILHHTSRDEPTRFSGTEQIKAAAEELWLYYPPELTKWRKGQPRPPIGPSRHLVFEKSRGGYQGMTFTVTRKALHGVWEWRTGPRGSDNPIQYLTYKFRAVKHDRWQIASEWMRELELEFNSRSLRRYLEQLKGSVLESTTMKSRKTGRIETHYRVEESIRQAAVAMVTSRGDGANEV